MTDSILKQEIDVAIRELEHKCIIYRQLAKQGYGSKAVAEAYEDASAHFRRAVSEDHRYDRRHKR